MSDTAQNTSADLGDLEKAEPTSEGSAQTQDLDDAADLGEALAQARTEAERYQNDYLRMAAELDNVRKRAARETQNARQFGIERFAGELLDVVDSLEMGLAVETATAEALREGSEATHRQLIAVFEKHGVTAIEPEGEPFDPEFHEAISTQESATAEPGSVLVVVQKGYVLNGRLLRPARVVVSAEASTDEA